MPPTCRRARWSSAPPASNSSATPRRFPSSPGPELVCVYFSFQFTSFTPALRGKVAVIVVSRGPVIGLIIGRAPPSHVLGNGTSFFLVVFPAFGCCCLRFFGEVCSSSFSENKLHGHGLYSYRGLYLLVRVLLAPLGAVFCNSVFFPLFFHCPMYKSE